MKRAPRIEFIDFKAMAHKDPRFRGSVGLFLDSENILAIDRNLPEETNGTRLLAISHELAHVRVRRSGAREYMSHTQEEAYCELEAIFATPDRALSAAEEIIKRVLRPGRRWSRLTDRRHIRMHLLCLVGVPQASQVTKLLEAYQ